MRESTNESDTYELPYALVHDSWDVCGKSLAGGVDIKSQNGELLGRQVAANMM
jgi:hypothetical protein